jgi:hypothetical protein
MAAINFVGGSYESISRSFDAQKTVNFYVEMDETKEGKSPVALIRTPGLRPFCAIGTQYGIRGRGLYTTHNDRKEQLFIVAGNTFFEATESGSLVQRGSLRTSEGPVSIADNGSFLVVVDGFYGYAYNLQTLVFTNIIDPDFPGADTVTVLDNYLIFNRPGTQQFFWTNLSGVDFDALDFTSVDGFPDRLLSVLAYRRELWLFGATTTERWYNAGDLFFPFQRIQGGFSEQGAAAAHSQAVLGDKLCWLTANQEGTAMVQLVLAGQVQRVSTHAVEHAWQQYPMVSDAIGWGEQRDGHEFYWLTFPSGNATWVFDLATGLWHERAYLNPTTGQLDRHRANAATYAFGQHFVGDWQNGNVYVLDQQTLTDNGAPMRAVRRAPYVSAAKSKSPANLPWIFHHTLHIDCEMGVGLATGQGSDPLLMLRWSDDGGATWTGERTARLGKMGERRARARFQRLGRSRARVYEASVTDPVIRTILGAYLESEVATV